MPLDVKHGNVFQLDARDHMNSKAQCWSLASLCVCVVNNEPSREKTLQGVTTDRHGSSLGLNNSRKVGELNGSLSGEKDFEFQTTGTDILKF